MLAAILLLCFIVGYPSNAADVETRDGMRSSLLVHINSSPGVPLAAQLAVIEILDSSGSFIAEQETTTGLAHFEHLLAPGDYGIKVKLGQENDGETPFVLMARDITVFDSPVYSVSFTTE